MHGAFRFVFHPFHTPMACHAHPIVLFTRTYKECGGLCGVWQLMYICAIPPPPPPPHSPPQPHGFVEEEIEKLKLEEASLQRRKKCLSLFLHAPPSPSPFTINPTSPSALPLPIHLVLPSCTILQWPNMAKTSCPWSEASWTIPCRTSNKPDRS